jgi:sulfur relay (sulfurtransferase) DsrF/TusC family protein
MINTKKRKDTLRSFVNDFCVTHQNRIFFVLTDIWNQKISVEMLEEYSLISSFVLTLTKNEFKSENLLLAALESSGKLMNSFPFDSSKIHAITIQERKLFEKSKNILQNDLQKDYFTWEIKIDIAL